MPPSFGPLSSLPFSSLPSGAAPAGADAAPGWEAQPSFIPAARRIAKALAAFTLTAGIEAVFVPPVVAAPTAGWEAQPQTIVKKSAVFGVQEQISLRSESVPFGWQVQPTSPRALRFLPRVQDVTLRSEQVLFGWHVQPVASTRIGQSRPNFEGWPLDVAAPAAPAPVWGWDQAATRPVTARWRITGTGESAIFAQTIPMGWDSGQPSRIATRSTVRGAPGTMELAVAPAVVVYDWWGEVAPPLVRAGVRIVFTFESLPLSSTVVPVVADVPLELGGGGFWDYHHGERRGERWKKRKKQLEALEARAAELAEAVPEDFPEARHAKAAIALVERASDTLLEGQDTFDWSRLADDVKAASAAIKRAEKAFTAYLAAVEEDDDDDFLMMV